MMKWLLLFYITYGRNSMAPQNTPGAPPPSCSRFLVLNGPGHCLFDLGHVLSKKSWPPMLNGPKSKMASKRLVWSDQLFSMGDNSKILFSIRGFSYPGNSKKIFFAILGVPMGTFWLVMGSKWAIVEQISKKI